MTSTSGDIPGGEVAALAAFVGTWSGHGEGHYPTIQPFEYTQEVELRPVPAKPFLAYRSATRHVDGRPLHAESGWMRLVGPAAVELVLAQGSGLVEIVEGPIASIEGGIELDLRSTVVAGSSTAKEVTATGRRYRVVGDELFVDFHMAAVGEPLTHHLHASLARQH